MTKKVLFALYCILALVPSSVLAQTAPDPTTVIISRGLAKSLYQQNLPYIEPLVRSLNATTNSRFFSSAKVSKKNAFSARFSLNGMFGFVRESDKSFVPTLHFDSIKKPWQTEGELVLGFLNPILQRALESGVLVLPKKAATIFGNMQNNFFAFGTPEVKKFIKDEFAKEPVYASLPQASRDRIDTILSQLPPGLTLAPGQNMSFVPAVVPQLELGTLYGTEMLLRWVPSISLDTSIGEFSFFGIGLKHSLSQYLNSNSWDIAIQGVYQTTHLKNVYGETKAELDATAKIWNANIQASNDLGKGFTFYSGLSWERILVSSTNKFTLPIELQWSIGMIPLDKIPTPEQPGDTEPQTVGQTIESNNLKGIVGISKDFERLRFALDYNFSKFNLASFSVSYLFGSDSVGEILNESGTLPSLGR